MSNSELDYEYDEIGTVPVRRFKLVPKRKTANQHEAAIRTLLRQAGTLARLFTAAVEDRDIDKASVLKSDLTVVFIALRMCYDEDGLF